jgi:hypothetical protein
MAFESTAVTTEAKNSREILTKHGLVAFFDILGYKNILSSNSAEEALKIVNASMLQSLKDASNQYRATIKPDTFVISDSAKLKAPVTTDRKFEEVVKSAQNAAVLVLVY